MATNPFWGSYAYYLRGCGSPGTENAAASVTLARGYQAQARYVSGTHMADLSFIDGIDDEEF